MRRIARLSCPLFAAALAASPAIAQRPPVHSQLVIVIDGLRPDYVTPEVMPRLVRLGQRGVVFTAHHSVFPTVTRVNASTFVTGVYPERHGLLGNTIYIPKANATKGLNTGAREDLELVERTDGKLLTAPTLSEILRPAGKSLLVVSSGSSGSALLLNHTLATGGIIHYEFVRPPALAAQTAAALGPAPAHATPNDPQNQYAIDAYLKVGLAGGPSSAGASRPPAGSPRPPDVTFMWLNDPDGTAHANGMAAPITRRSLSLVDAGIGRVEDALREKGLLDSTNIIATSDHGFSAHTGELKLAALVAPFAKPLPDGSPDLVVAEGAIHFRSPVDPARVAAIVAALQRRPEVGAIFTRPRPVGGAEGIVPGTLSFDVARWNHPRAGEILVSANWTDAADAAGFKGTTTDGGVAGHGSSSPFDVHNTLIAAGPDFREHATSSVPTSNVDIAPTLLRLIGLPVPASMQGRVIEEGLRNGRQGMDVVRHTLSVTNADGTYTLTAHVSEVAGRRYLDSTDVQRK